MTGNVRTYVYIDEFNLYYRALKDTPYKWLNLKTLFGYLLDPKNDIQTTKYFTALVSGKIDPNQPLRQKTYLRAIQKCIPELSVYYGHFLSHVVSAPLAKSWLPPVELLDVVKNNKRVRTQ